MPTKRDELPSSRNWSWRKTLPENPTCPFHGEAKIALTRNGDLYHCTVCGWSGDVVAVLMQTEGITFREALKRIGRDQ
jgi:hypothetical protein